MYNRRHDASALTGEGARLYGGRWNSPGKAAVYTASTLALALLEIMANARRRVPPGYVYRAIDIPDDARTDRVLPADLPRKWFLAPAPHELREIGDAWLRRVASVALLVPSAIARIEYNVILNPNHSDFGRLVVGEPEDIPVDERLRAPRKG